MKLFVDTSAWAAFYDASDQWHAAAKGAMASLVNTRFEQAGFQLWPGMGE